MPRKPPLTEADWSKAEASCFAADASLGRIVSALNSSSRLDKLAREWADTRSRIGDLADDLFRSAGRERATPSIAESTLRWFDAGRSGARRSEPFTRAEWAVLGDEIKNAQGALEDILQVAQSRLPKVEHKKWSPLHETIKNLKYQLGMQLGRQHPQWIGQADPMTGDLLIDNPILRSSLNMSEVAAIRAY